MLIGILQTGHAPDELRAALGDYSDMFRQLLAGRGFEFTDFNVVEMEFPPDVHAADGWLLTGSRHGTYEHHAFIPPLEDFIRAAYAAHVPMVGICFGHQIIAQALGGRVEKYSGGWSVGATDYDIAGQQMTLNAWHQDQVTALPPGATVLGSSGFCPYAALAYDDDALTVQAHPEFSAGMIDGLASTRGKGVVPAPLLQQAHANLSRPTDSARLADMMTEFFLKPREASHG